MRGGCSALRYRRTFHGARAEPAAHDAAGVSCCFVGGSRLTDSDARTAVAPLDAPGPFQDERTAQAHAGHPLQQARGACSPSLVGTPGAEMNEGTLGRACRSALADASRGDALRRFPTGRRSNRLRGSPGASLSPARLAAEVCITAPRSRSRPAPLVPARARRGPTGSLTVSFEDNAPSSPRRLRAATMTSTFRLTRSSTSSFAVTRAVPRIPRLSG